MPRAARIDMPDLLQHVIARGVERRPVFIDDRDRERFVSLLSKLLPETGTRCFAWVLLDNHFHLFLKPQSTSLAEVMRRLLTGYAVYFNRRHKRAGHLFQNRYKSLVCGDDQYLLLLVRYIHLNPLRAKMVDSLEGLAHFRWCGHRELLTNEPGLLDRDEVLSYLSPKREAAIKNYLTFMDDGLKQPSSVKLSRGGRESSLWLDDSLDENGPFDERILGGGEQVGSLLIRAGLPLRGGGDPFSEIFSRIAKYYGLTATEICQPNRERKIAAAKAAICHVALRHLGQRGVDLAELLKMSPSAVTHAARRGRVLLGQDPELRKVLSD